MVLVFINSTSCQTNSNDFEKSKKIEKEAWKLLFSEKFDAAKIKFSEDLKTCDTNYNVYLGLAALKGINGDENYINYISKACKDNEYLLSSYGPICVEIVSYFESPLNDRDTSDDTFNEVKAMLTDGKYIERIDKGKIYLEGQYKNNKRNGVWKYYDMDNNVFKTITYSDSNNVFTYKYFKSNGDIIREESWEVINEATGSSTTLKKIVYWQEIPGKNKEYLFVSKNGFCTYEKDKSNVLDSNTPDNVIEEAVDKDYLPIWYIWKNGKREKYKGCDYDGKRFTIIQGSKKGTYEWKNCELILIEN